MKTSTFAILAVVTVAVAGGAYWATQQREAGVSEVFARQPLYPNLLARVNDVNALTISTQADGTLTMSRQSSDWRLAEKHGYFVDRDRISQTLVELASMETLEPKTQRPENYPDLAVEDVEAPEGTTTNSIRVTAKAGDEVLADLLVGRTRPVDIGGGVFVRKADEEQAWLASGSYQPRRKPLQWLDRSIVNIDSRRTVRVEVEHADGEGFAVAKPDIDSENMAYATPVPEGKEPKPAHEMNAMASITDFLILDDVRPAQELDWNEPTAVGRYMTYDGLQLTITAVKDGDATWFRLAAEAAERDPRLDTFVVEHQGQDSAEGRMAGEMKSAEAVAAEITSLNERIGPWAYRFTDYKTGKATSRTASMLQDAASTAQQ